MRYRENESGLHILEIEITNRCNLSCSHCYVDNGQCRDMDKKTILQVIEESNRMGINRLVLTGGEPLMHDNLFETANYAKALGIPEIVLLTNGILINPNNAADLKAFDLVQLSLDYSPSTAITMRKDYLDTLLTKINLLKANKIKPLLFTTVYKSLLPFLDEIISLAHSLEVNIAFNKLVPVKASLNDECLSQEEYYQLLRDLVHYQKEGYQVQCSDPLMFLVDEENMHSMEERLSCRIAGGCTAGVAALYINASGDIYPCPFLNIASGNVYLDSLEDIWNSSSILAQLRKRKEFSGECGDCKYIYHCGGCRAASYRKYGNLISSDPNCFLNNKLSG